jgi:hypothetical protein
MTVPLLDLDASTEETLFAAIVDILQADETLSRVIQTWEVMDGTTAILEPPTTVQMPHVRIVPSLSPMVVAEAAAYDLHLANQLNLWGAIRTALRGTSPFRDTFVFEHVRSLGGVDLHLTSPRFGPMPRLGADGGSRAQDLVGACQVVVMLQPNS